MKKGMIIAAYMTIFVLISSLPMVAADGTSDPNAIYPENYEVILKDNTGDRIYLNFAKQEGSLYLFRGLWSSKWATGFIEPVAALYNSATESMAITAVYKGNMILGYQLSLTAEKYFSGSWAYMLKYNDHHYNKVFSSFVHIEKDLGNTFTYTDDYSGNGYNFTENY